MSNLDWQVFGLVGAAQASEVLKKFLEKGFLEQNQLNAMVRSIFVTNSKSLEHIYGEDLSLWNLGKSSLQKFLTQAPSLNTEEFYYFMSILKLAKILQSNRSVCMRINGYLNKIRNEVRNKDLNFEYILQELNELYKISISSLNFRVKVKIRQSTGFDSQQEARMRVLLFAGIRSAFLWRQGGGSVPNLLFQRTKILTELKKIPS